MKKQLLFILFFNILFTFTLYAQIQPLTGNELPGVLLVDSDIYNQESIWKYNSDMAPLASEYGFHSLLVQKFMVGDQNYKLEAYMMTNPQAAYGIYSISILNCPVQDSITSFDCLTRYRYQAAYGQYYIIVTNESEKPAALEYNYTIARKFMQMNHQLPMVLPDVFNAPAFSKNRGKIVFLNGMDGMQNSLMPWTNLVVAVRFNMYAVMLPDPRGDIYFAQISFPTQGDMYTFFTRAKLMQHGIPVQAYNDYGFLFREYTTPDPANPLTIYFLQCTQPVAVAEITAE